MGLEKIKESILNTCNWLIVDDEYDDTYYRYGYLYLHDINGDDFYVKSGKSKLTIYNENFNYVEKIDL